MNQLLDKFLGNHPPITSTAQACQFADYFNAKIEQIYSDMFYHKFDVLRGRLLGNHYGFHK